MPLKKGRSPDVVQSNIKELIAAGHSQKQAVAAALAEKRKHMAHGGLVDDDEDDDKELETPTEIQHAMQYEPDEVGGHKELAASLRDQLDEVQGFSDGGEVEDEPNPAEPGVAVETHIPPPANVSDEAKLAIEERKKKRKFTQSAY